MLCSRCGHSGAANRLTCPTCGAQLPDAPFLEGTVTAQRRLHLSARRLEWTRGDHIEGGVDLSSLTRVALKVRPVYETLLFAGPLGLGAATHAGAVRWVLAALALVAVAACFVQRRYGLLLEGATGRRIVVGLAVAFPGSERARRVASVWESLAAELPRLGPKVG